MCRFSSLRLNIFVDILDFLHIRLIRNVLNRIINIVYWRQWNGNINYWYHIRELSKMSIVFYRWFVNMLTKIALTLYVIRIRYQTSICPEKAMRTESCISRANSVKITWYFCLHLSKPKWQGYLNRQQSRLKYQNRN